ncbi:hypothetical protein Patl1_20605 [Pistacia atlantica]|uniref:Uncharacterized protein n=1 Tax=Pistacia atlantica TaxID=434234 RepID=A0ACC1BJK2_9ROSI|nr:hypothetical protein Patl1_20605 [Pistacia atlantica]
MGMCWGLRTSFCARRGSRMVVLVTQGPSMEAMTRRSLLLGVGIVMAPMALMMPLVILVHLWGRRGFEVFIINTSNASDAHCIC